jgi:hypothetical protein
MIDQSMIPMEVKRAMRVTWARRNNSDAPEKHMADLAVAMLEAWPGMHVHETRRSWLGGFSERELMLPLPQEKPNDC